MEAQSNTRKVLVLDDEPQILSSIEDLLEDDFAVYSTTDAEEALRILRAEEIMVILCDQRMPRMTGDQFLERARQVCEATRVLITGYSDLNALVRAVNNGQIYAYVAKPWDPMELKIAVRKAADHYELLQKLNHERELLHILMDSIPDSIYFKDAAGRFTRINRAKARVLGVESPEEAVGKMDHDFFPEEQVLDTYANEQRIIREGEPMVDRIVRLTKAAGKDQWFSTTKAPIRDRNGQVVGLVGINRNITERKETEDSLRQSEARLRALIENHPDGVCLLDTDYRIVLSNTTAQKHLKLLGNEAEGERITHLGEMEIDEALAPCEDGLSHEVSVSEETDRIFEVEGRPIPAESADRGGWVLVIRDATLEREIRDRIQKQYHLASVGQLAAGIAHDFNNLLTVMMGTAQLLEMRHDIPDAVKEDIKTIYVQGQRASQLVRQVLDFSRQTVVEQHPLDLVPFLRETTRMLQRTMPEIQIETDIDDGSYIIEANLTQLQQIITNLAVNARDAMPEGGTLRIGLSHLRLKPGDPPPFSMLEPGAWAVWTMSDTGTGIPPDVMKHIYEPFFTTKAPGEGTGLGLAQVYGIVRQHNGFIDVESTVGEGTTFTIYLPQILDEVDLLESTPADMVKGQGETILVIEDKTEVLEMARSMLENLNYQVFSAEGGEEALSIYDTHQNEISLVLSDVVMPDMGGIALFKALRKRNPQVPVVMMTGYPLGEQMELLSSLGVSGWLEKPLSLDRVAQAVNQALKDGKGSGSE